MKLLPLLAASCLCAVAYTSNTSALETSTDTATASVDPTVSGALANEEGGDGSPENPAADDDGDLESSGSGAERDAKNAIYLDLLGPGLFYSINYDRIITDDLSARIGLSYLSLGASTSDGTGTTASAEFSYLAVPLTVSYLGIGSQTNMLELGGGAVIMQVKGSGIIEADGESEDASASATILSATGMVGYRRQPADGGFVFRIGASPLMTFQGDFVPWGYLSLGAAF